MRDRGTSEGFSLALGERLGQIVGALRHDRKEPSHERGFVWRGAELGLPTSAAIRQPAASTTRHHRRRQANCPRQRGTHALRRLGFRLTLKKEQEVSSTLQRGRSRRTADKSERSLVSTG